MSSDDAPKKPPAPSTLPVPLVDNDKLDEAIRDLPPQQQERIRHTIQETFRETFMAVVQGVSPKLEPETAKIITASIDKDNELKFRYMSQKQKDEADSDLRSYNFAVTCHRDRNRMLWPILILVLILVAGCIIAGIYFAANGKELLGASLLTGIFSAVFGYLAGLGTSHFLNNDDE